MGRTLDEVVASLPARRRKKIEKRGAELVEEVENLKKLRKLARVSQEGAAKEMNVSQPAISKLERQADPHLSTLKSYAKAIGAELEFVFRLPGRRKPVKVKSLDVLAEAVESPMGEKERSRPAA